MSKFAGRQQSVVVDGVVPSRASPPFRSPPTAAEVHATPAALRMLLGICLIFSFPAFTIQLALNMATGQWVGSPILQAMTLGTELLVFCAILGSQSTRSLVAQCWPILALIMFAFVSAIWSQNRAATIQTANTYMTTALLGLVIVGLLPGFQSVKFVVRTMAVGCLLSILWVVLFPETAIHQLSDPYQTVHAGLWRGVFSHKQGLGYFSGLTVGLLLFYRTSIFPAPVWAFFLVCSVMCLIGSGSATGMVATAVAPAFLFMAYFIARLPLPFRQPMVVKFAIGVAIIGLAFRLGILNYVIVQILGKSTDLTGRADFWPIILQNFYASGHSFLGGGFGAKIAADMSEWSVDNGYVDKFLEFGYLITPLIFGIFVLILWKGIRLVVANPGGQTSANIFPFAVWCVTLILNISESNFMTKCLSTVLTSVAVGLIVQQAQSSSRRQRVQFRRVD
ncbi:hypothetical protein IVB41_32560 [Bradyrhizobium sp. 44]|uniref:O-antigen ligase family protein n=1 Tax=Bradyrhizobium sp. 44 TaxID=2782675 RepID=UPI001FF75663|nr:hypothetical protein [Bradyrhizobium sp. 44]MCK1288640.1 hypothetical protein [Bradyrhizobium sp. 44]